MSKCYGWNKKQAEALMKSFNTKEVMATTIKEEWLTLDKERFDTGFQWVVVLQKRRNK